MDRSAAVENISSNGGLSVGASMVTDAANNTFIVWTDHTPGNYDIFFSKWTPTGCGGIGCWTAMDGTAGNENISNNSSYSSGAQIGLTTSGIPYVVWFDNSPGNYDIFFKKWTAGAGESVCGTGINDCWTKMDGTAGADNVSGTALTSASAHLAIDNNNNPYIAWDEAVPGGKSQIYFRKWSGSAWIKMDGTSGTDNISNNSGISYGAQIALDSNNMPYITWYDNTTGNGDIYLKKWTPAVGWTKMDGTPGHDNISNNSSISETQKMLLDSFGNPYVIWRDVPSGKGQVFFSKWSGTSWTKMDGTAGNENVSDTSGTAESATFKLDQSNTPYIAWRDTITGNGDIYFTKWSGTAWIKMDGTPGHDNVSGTATTSRYPEMSISSAGNPNIVWQEEKSIYNYEIYFRKWTPAVNDWTKMGDAAGTDNLSNNGNSFSQYPKILLSNINMPKVVWEDDIDGNSEIYFTHWITDAQNSVNISASVESTITLSLPSATINLGSFSSSNIVTGVYTASVSTNGSGGYAAYLRADGKLRNATNDINDVTGGAVADGTEAYGVSTTKASQPISQINDANSDTFYTASDCTTMNGNTIHANASAISTSDQQFASADSPVSDDETSLCFAVAIAGSSPAGAYNQILTLTVVGNY